jgi:hypothetical protein
MLVPVAIQNTCVTRAWQVGVVITVELAKSLRDAGLRWHPETGDRFVIDKPGVDEDVYTVSEMTVERHDHPSGTILGFNGTTGLTRVAAGERVVHTVTATIAGLDRTFAAEDPAIAYGQALAAYITAALE